MVHNSKKIAGWMPKIVNEISAMERPRLVPRFDDMVLAMIRLE
jgi:hypothetical protein